MVKLVPGGVVDEPKCGHTGKCHPKASIAGSHKKWKIVNSSSSSWMRGVVAPASCVGCLSFLSCLSQEVVSNFNPGRHGIAAVALAPAKNKRSLSSCY